MRLRKWLKRAALAIGGVALVFAALAIAFALHCHNVQARFSPSPHDSTGSNIAGLARPEDDTFLTYAEWYIVWSYQEKGAWQQAHLPSEFPYFGAIEQYWSGYCCSYSVVRDKYPFNFGDHVMLVVIGTSFTVEYLIKGIYENTVGRLSAALSGHEMAEEDRYAARVAQEYGAFVADRPFYEFSFLKAFRGLWSETKFWGPHPLRKWERKLWLSTDYFAEAVYCGLIELASHATYGVEEDVTYAVVEKFSASIPGVQTIRSLGPDLYIVKMPRYRKFTDTAKLLLQTPARFVSIAGNRQIMVTAIVPEDWTFQSPTGESLFSLPLLTNRHSKRIALRMPVGNLDSVAATTTIEHIYDY